MSAPKIATIFPTSLVVQEDALTVSQNRALELEIYRLRAKDPEGIYRSNVEGTWHSQDVILRSCGEPGHNLGDAFHSMFSVMASANGGRKGTYKWKLEAWAMMYGDRGYATAHTHPNCTFSGVYYVAAEEIDALGTQVTGVAVKPGALEFIDTRGINLKAPGVVMQPAARVYPKVGRMVGFPSWVPHFVHPVRGDGPPRIAVACNATILNFEPEKE